MTLPLTPDSLAAAYEFLRTCPPFKSWKLPHADEVEFRVTRDQTCHGAHQGINGKHFIIEASEAGIGHTITLIKVIAHEMIHLWEYRTHQETPGAVHNAKFRTTARVVCEIHGWDVKAFFL